MAERVVVLVDSNRDVGNPDVQEVLRQAQATGAAARVLSAEEIAEQDYPEAVVIGSAVRELIKAARKLSAAGCDSHFIFVADPTQVAEMRRQLSYAGPAGNGWSLEAADSSRLVDVIRNGITGIHRGKQLRSTLDRINSRMAQWRTVDAARYRELLASDRYLATILKHAEDAIISLSSDGRIWSWNRGAEALFGVATPDAVGTSLETLFAERSTIAEAVAKTAAGEVIRREVTPASSGRVKHLDAVFTPVRDEADRVNAIAVIVRDITEQKLAAEALKEADRRKDEFLAVLAHELRNPLAPIRNAIELMKLPGAGEADRLRSRDIAERQVHHMARLLDDLLDVSRISRGRLELRKERVLLEEAIEAATETARPVIDAKRHKLAVVLPKDAITLDADPVRLTQIFGNLLSNAAKYAAPQGHIDVTARIAGNLVEVAVKDDGVGIPREMLPHVFEMFTQAASAGSGSGIGVGLAITRGLVTLHGGQIEARSEGPGRGSEFVVRLPLSVRADAPDKTQTAPGEAQSAQSRRILVVDDNVDSADSLAMTLQFSGHTTKTAYDGATALEVFEEFRPDVVLLDIGMPQMDGREVARRMRAMPRGENVLLVALTGWGQEQDRQRSAAAGFDEHVTKPANHALLMELIGRARTARR